MLSDKAKELLRKLDLEYPCIAIKLHLEKPACPRYEGKKLAFCQYVREAQATGAHFHITAEDDDCYGKLAMGMIDIPPVTGSGQAGYDFGVYKAPIANQQLYQKLPRIIRGTVRYVEFCPAVDAEFDPDLLMFVADLPQADIIMRATSYISGDLWESKSSPVISCAWMYAYPIISGKVNHITTGFYHGLKRRGAYPAGLRMIAVPYPKIDELFLSLEQMDWTLIAFRDDPESKAELARRMEHWQEMGRDTGSQVDLHSRTAVRSRGGSTGARSHRRAPDAEGPRRRRPPRPFSLSSKGLFPQQVAHRRDRMLRDHAGTAVAHGGADLLAHLGRVAVVAALLARRLDVHLAAALGAQHGVGVQLGAGGADVLSAEGLLGARVGGVVAGAVHGDHLRDRPLLALAALGGFRRVLFHTAYFIMGRAGFEGARPPFGGRRGRMLAPNGGMRYHLRSSFPLKRIASGVTDDNLE